MHLSIISIANMYSVTSLYCAVISIVNQQDLAIKTADAHGSTIILATDPDADRLALAEKQPEYVTSFLIDKSAVKPEPTNQPTSLIKCGIISTS